VGLREKAGGWRRIGDERLNNVYSSLGYWGDQIKKNIWSGRVERMMMTNSERKAPSCRKYESNGIQQVYRHSLRTVLASILLSTGIDRQCQTGPFTTDMFIN
jgi:hypothetical protein